MGGWHRLFVAFAVVTALGMGFWFLSFRPSEYDVGKYALSDCEVFHFVSPESARKYLDQGYVHDTEYPDVSENSKRLTPTCTADIKKYTSGESLRTARASWMEEFPLLIGFYLAGLALAYGIGWSIGWIWRGFKPRNEKP